MQSKEVSSTDAANMMQGLLDRQAIQDTISRYSLGQDPIRVRTLAFCSSGMRPSPGPAQWITARRGHGRFLSRFGEMDARR